MTELEFLNEIDEILQVEPGTTSKDDQIASLANWDSMALIMFISMADEKFHLTLDAEAVSSCETVADLERLCQSRSA